MASLDFEQEKDNFRRFYDSNRKYFVQAKNIYIRSISSLITRCNVSSVTKIDGRVKDKEECIKKLHRKYQNSLEIDEQAYEIIELADREFTEIRNETKVLMQQEAFDPMSDSLGTVQEKPGKAALGTKTVNAFNFMRTANHFFRDFEFEDFKVDNFVHNILKLDSDFQKSDLHKCLTENLKIVKEYRDISIVENPQNTFSPYTLIRHCLYLYDPETFGRIFSMRTRERFAGWLKEFNECSA